MLRIYILWQALEAAVCPQLFSTAHVRICKIQSRDYIIFFFPPRHYQGLKESAAKKKVLLKLETGRKGKVEMDM